MLKGSKENECRFPDLPEILHKLLKKGFIELSESKHPE